MLTVLDSRLPFPTSRHVANIFISCEQQYFELSTNRNRTNKGSNYLGWMDVSTALSEQHSAIHAGSSNQPISIAKLFQRRNLKQKSRMVMVCRSLIFYRSSSVVGAVGDGGQNVIKISEFERISCFCHLLQNWFARINLRLSKSLIWLWKQIDESCRFFQSCYRDAMDSDTASSIPLDTETKMGFQICRCITPFQCCNGIGLRFLLSLLLFQWSKVF